MNRKTAIALGASLLVATAAAAYASERLGDGNPGKRFWKEADSNGDGTISSEEMVAAISVRFKQADANADGIVTRVELLEAVEKRAEGRRMARHAGMFADGLVLRLDIDDDGKVTLNEVENRARKHFALADFNDDGKVERAELKRLAPRHAGFGNARWGHDGRMPGAGDAE
jgi:Ca2+-binding EF-hand superfamily protein